MLPTNQPENAEQCEAINQGFGLRVDALKVGDHLMAQNPADQRLGGKPDGLRESRSRLPILFLLRLQHERFPVLVTEPAEIRQVSVLAATGLIKAQIASLKATEPYVSPQRAMVFRITDEGRAEIAQTRDAPTPAVTSVQLLRGPRLM